MEPETASSAMDRAQLSQHLTNRSDWSRNGGQFEPSELAIINDLTSQCRCGGDMVSEWKDGVLYRCPACRGYRLQL